MDSNLTKMPDVVMKYILEHLDFESIQALRKVCHKFKNFIDEKKIDFKLREITVDYYTSKIKLMIRTSVRYLDFFCYKKDRGCLVVKEKRLDPPDKTHFVEDIDFVTVFLQQFEVLLSHQKSALRNFNVYTIFPPDSDSDDFAQKFLDGLRSILKNRKRQLRVQKLYMLITSQEDVLRVLPHLDPDYLERIDLNHAHEYPKRTLQIDKLVNLEQWKNSWELGIWRCYISESIQNLSHFSKAEFLMHECSLDMLYVLKENLLNSYYFNLIKIYFKTFQSADEDNIIRVFGRPLEDRENNTISRKRCFSRITNSDYVLVVTLIDRRYSSGFRINLVPLEFVPKKVLKKQLLF